MTAIEYRDRPPPGDWHVLDVMREKAGKWDWVALMIDVDPDEHCSVYGRRATHSAWVRVPGKHRNWDAAWDALADRLATRH